MSATRAAAVRRTMAPDSGARWTLPALLAIGWLALGASNVHAQCTRPADLKRFAVAAGRAIRCYQHRLVAGSHESCAVAKAPACAGDALDRVVRLTFGTSARARRRARAVGDDARAALRCQGGIAKASAAFLIRRVIERSAGRRAEGGSRAAMGFVIDRCAGIMTAGRTDGGAMPALGAPCDGRAPVPGTPVDPVQLIRCLRPTLEGILDGVAPSRLRPNLIVVNTDDQRWSTVSYMPAVLEQLAARGISFSNSFVTTPLCGPSRASLLTGRYAHDTGVLDNAGPHGGARVFDDSSTVATWLHDAGYRTALIGKYINSYSTIAPRVPPGWDTWRAFQQDDRVYFNYTLVEDGVPHAYGSTPQDYSTDVLGAMAQAFVHANADAPFFLYLAPFAPHPPATPAPRDAGMYAGIAPWRPPNFEQPPLRDPSLQAWQLLQIFSLATHPGLQDANDQLRISQLETLPAVDDAMSAILGQLEGLGLEDDTVVIFTSDNGTSWDEHWVWGKECPYEECLRVPLVMRYPARYPAPRQENRMVLNIDLAPTLAELAGVPIPTTANGRSLLGLLDDTAPWRTDFLAEYWVRASFFLPTWNTVRTDRWKYNRYPDSTPDKAHTELFDLATDPYELTNRAGDPAVADVEAGLAARLEALLAE